MKPQQHVGVEHQTINDVIDAIAGAAAEVENLERRADLLREVVAHIKRRRWSLSEVATRANLSDPRVNDLMRGRLSRFTLQALEDIATAIGHC